MGMQDLAMDSLVLVDLLLGFFQKQAQELPVLTGMVGFSISKITLLLFIIFLGSCKGHAVVQV
jgi:hypothetical protein